MVWALIFVLCLCYNPPAFAEELDVSAAFEEVAEDGEPEETSVSDSDDSDLSVGDSVLQPEDLDLDIPDSYEPEVSSVLAAPVRASSSYSSIYGSVATNSSYLNGAASVLPKLSWLDDYVFFRAGQYEYVLAVGDLDYSGGSFSGSGLTFYSFVPASGYNTDLSFSTSTGSLQLSVGSYLVYSNLGDFPVLDSAWDASVLILFLGWVALICSCLRFVWSWLLRSGQNVYLS